MLSPIREMKCVTHIDCFSGAGGFCTGFKAAGIKTLVAIEKVESCATTYSANHPETLMVNRDIRKVTRGDLGALPDIVDIVSAGMPCETFSTAGSKSRSFYDDRQTLFQEAIRIARMSNARLILFENVPAITTKRTEKNGNRLVIDDIYNALSEAGYKYYIDTILNAVDFGVPQERLRFFILASKEQMPLRAPLSKRNGRVSVRDAFAGLPEVEANFQIPPDRYSAGDTAFTRQLKDTSFWKTDAGTRKLSYHVPPNHRPGTLRRFRMIRQGEGLKDLFDKLDRSQVERLQAERVLPKKWYIQRNRRLVADEPSVTVTSHCLDELIHPTQNRALTVREVARLQGFPDFYDFRGGPFICPHIYETQDKYEQVGDSVPPLLAYHWGLTLRELLST